MGMDMSSLRSYILVIKIGSEMEKSKKAASIPIRRKDLPWNAGSSYFYSSSCSQMVEVPGVEPGSGEGINELSTCLA
jgi:hypothetical protein